MHSGRYNRSVEVTVCETMVERWLYFNQSINQSYTALSPMLEVAGIIF